MDYAQFLVHFKITVLSSSFFFSAYTIYAFFEWSLIIYDVAFDAVTSIDFERFEIKVTHSDNNMDKKRQEDKEVV
jgi:hypothetical protein